MNGSASSRVNEGYSPSDRRKGEIKTSGSPRGRSLERSSRDLRYSKSPVRSRSPYRRRHSFRSSSRSRSISRERSRSRHRRSRYKSQQGRRSYHDSPYYSRSRTPPRYRRRSPDRESERHIRENRDPATPCKVLGVFGLSVTTTEKDLKAIFSEYGRINEALIIYDNTTKKSRGFGFIYLDSVEEARVAREKTNGMNLGGRTIRVDYSKTKGPHAPTPGQYMGSKPRYSRRSPPRYSPRRSSRYRRSPYSRSRSR